ncbi:hypothetical protein [Herbaspirillum hiltneri]|uniref:hypothetical protein n=1 Tax=Herbaspirillum hiltneri TaxID=341045 RepID=UPI001395D539|nr:hypothetical protein [Herbaspirillum hiltneri]
MQKILSCSMRFSLFSLVAGWSALDCMLQAGRLAMPALFHNQESAARADKSAQMFYGERRGGQRAGLTEKLTEKRG